MIFLIIYCFKREPALNTLNISITAIRAIAELSLAPRCSNVTHILHIA